MPDFKRLAALPCGRRSKWIILAFWIAVFVVSGPLASKLTGAQENDSKAWLPKNAESTKVVDLSEKFVPSDTFPAIVVYERSDGAPLTQADKDKAAADARAFPGVSTDKVAKPVSKVEGPNPSQDTKGLLTVVSIKVGDDGWDALPGVVDKIRAISDKGGGDLKGYVTGPAGYGADFSEVFQGFDATLLYITAAIVIIILLITYRSPILWLLPLLCVAVALFVAQALIYLLTHVGLTVNGQSAFILTVLVFGAGTDYALLLIARYREELRTHEDRHEAMAMALYRAGPAIIASGATVALSLLCLLVATLASTKSLGPVMAIGVAVGLAAMVTLLPALLVICGRWLFWPRRPVYGSDEPTEQGLWARIGRRIGARPRLTWVATAVVLGIMALGLTSLNPTYLSGKDSFSSGKPESVTGEEVQSKHFPGGSGSPVQVIGSASAKQQLTTALSGVAKVTDVKSPFPDRDGLAYIEGTLNAPPDSKEAFSLVQKVRDTVHAVPSADAKVGGGPAVSYDVNQANSRDTKLVVPIVLIVVFIILAILLRALVAPLILVATVVLSFAAALGVSAWFFDHVLDFAGTDRSFPLWVFVFLVALGVDYNIFLMGRVHEEAKKHGTRRGALIGLAATGGVITSAGAVLAGTFGALGSLPLVFVTELGFAVAFGVLLDTFIVRSVLVTAITLDVGPRIWWMSRLSHETPTGTPAHPKYAPKEDETAGAR